MGIGQKTLTIAAASVLILGAAAVGGPSTSGGGPSRRGPRWQGSGSQRQRPGMSALLTRRLDLTDEQTEKIRSISQESRTQAQEANRAVVEARKALSDCVEDGAEEEPIRAAARALAKAIEDQAVSRGRTLASIKGVLTDEQREQLEKAKERAGQLRGRARGRRGSGRPGPRQSDNWAPPQRGRAERAHRRQNADSRAGQGISDRRGRGYGRAARPGGGRWAPSMDESFRGPGRGNGPWADGRPFVGRRGPQAMRGNQGRGPLPVGRAFDRVETNDDDALSREEIDSFRDEMRTR
jgi:Spy/CpxP family protein refolding chaperone